jgi:glycosyltransferase involved in cell wall biosynthesis
MRKLHGEIPIYFRGDSTLLDPRPRHKAWMRKALLRWVYSKVDIAFAVGTRSREYFLSYGLPGERICFAPHSVDNARFAEAASTRDAEALQWRRKLNIPDSSVAFLFAGKLESKKSPDLILESFLSLGSSKDAHLIFVGSGELEGELRARAHSRVHFLGFQNQAAMPRAYRLGDLFLLPSRGPGETWGLAVNEAMACGRPACVSHRVGCAVDLVQDGVTGWTVPAESSTELAGVMTQAVGMGREGLAAMGARARGLIQEWSFESQVRAIHARLIEDAGR